MSVRRDFYYNNANAYMDGVRRGLEDDAARPSRDAVSDGEVAGNGQPVTSPHFMSTLPERPDALRLEAIAASLRRRADHMGPELGEAHLSRALAEIADAVAFLLRGGKS